MVTSKPIPIYSLNRLSPDRMLKDQDKLCCMSCGYLVLLHDPTQKASFKVD
jgi:hypothetical protein